MMKKWLYAFIGLLSMLLAGFIYAWSILSAPILAEFPSWNSPAFSFTFTLCIIFFCLGSILSGVLARRMPAQRCILAAGILFLLGFFFSSRISALWHLYIGYGVLAGCASGLAYGAVMNIVPQHFPDRPGLISGILLMGFGASSLAIGSVFTAMTSHSPETSWRGTLMLFGIVIGIILILSGMVLSAPNKTASATKHNISDKDFTPSQMVSTVSFWLLILWTILIAGLGLVVISQARSFLLQVDTTLSPAVISLMVGLISVCNGLGRLIFGAIYDSLDWRKTIFAICSVNILGAVVLYVGLRGSLILLVISFGLIGLGYGGAPTFNAAVAKRFYGASYYPINFPIINLNLLVSSFIPTLASGMLARSGNYSSISLLLIAMACVSILAALPLKKPNL